MSSAFRDPLKVKDEIYRFGKAIPDAVSVIPSEYDPGIDWGEQNQLVCDQLVQEIGKMRRVPAFPMRTALWDGMVLEEFRTAGVIVEDEPTGDWWGDFGSVYNRIKHTLTTIHTEVLHYVRARKACGNPYRTISDVTVHYEPVEGRRAHRLWAHVHLSSGVPMPIEPPLNLPTLAELRANAAEKMRIRAQA